MKRKHERVHGIDIIVERVEYNKVFTIYDPSKLDRIDLCTGNQHEAHEWAIELAAWQKAKQQKNSQPSAV